MFLADTKIREYLAEGKIKVEPPVAEKDIRSVGIRVHLGDEILIPEPGQTLDLDNPQELKYAKVDLKEKGYLLKSREFVLATTLEKIQTSRDIVAFIEGRSTVARLGLTVHVTSCIIDDRCDSLKTIVLEMKNEGNLDIILRPGYPIGMVTFSKLFGEISQKDAMRYNGQDSVKPPIFNFIDGSK